REPQEAVEVIEVGGLGDDLEHDVETLMLMVDLVGEATHAPLVGGSDAAPAGGDQFAAPVDHTLDNGLLERSVEDDHDFVRSHRAHHLPVDPACRGPARCGAGSSNDRAMLAESHAL